MLSTDIDYKDPTFIRNTSYLQWKKEGNCYISIVGNIRVYIFYTMFPTVDHRNKNIAKTSEQKFINLGKTFTDTVVDQYLLSTYTQTDYDTEFTKLFYDTLKNTIIKIKERGGFTTCFSFAVFAADTDKYFIGQNYGMFKEIAQIFDSVEDQECGMLAEWNFKLNNYKVCEYYTKKILMYSDNDIKITNNGEKIECDISDIGNISGSERKLQQIEKNTRGCKRMKNSHLSFYF
jgi:hypothetical protein